MNAGFYMTLMMGRTNARAVPQSVIDALLGVEVITSSGERSGFQLTFAPGKQSSIMLKHLPEGDFDPKTRVIILVTLNGTPEVLMDGVITQHQVAPGDKPGQTILTITGEDLTRLMDLEPLTGKQTYENTTLENQVEAIIDKYAQYGLEADVTPSALKDEVPDRKEVTPKHHGTDLEHIKRLAATVGHVFYLEPGPSPGRSRAYWGPEVKKGQAQPALSLIMDPHSNVESLNFTYDGFSRSSVSVDLLEDGSGDKQQEDAEDNTELNPSLGANVPPAFRKEKLFVADKHGRNRARAMARAKAAQSGDVVSASGQLNVLRYGHVLKARRLVGVRGAGTLYDGLYYVTSVTHNIKRGEYKQSFTLSRNALGSSNQTVAV